ncbi:MAG: hypothetical protein LBD04_06685 [Synergistaceae bacterium]|jgi:hypothetical protein|nr:hypothetical protein [Synergistaceae bacterium]
MRRPGFGPEYGRGSGSGGGIPEAPLTGETYGRGNGGWRAIPAVYTHTQSAPAAVWNIQHNIGQLPVSVVTLSALGDRIIGEEDWAAATAHLFVVRFSEPLTGVAFVRY